LVRGDNLVNSLADLNAVIRESIVPAAGFLRASCALV
jgi:hypothetical protein